MIHDEHIGSLSIQANHGADAGANQPSGAVDQIDCAEFP
jgi:hypothetical protein